MPETNILDYRQFWHFSVTVGALAELLSQADRLHQGEAFTAGVIHNIGRLALDQQLPEGLARSLARAERDQLTLHDAEREEMGFTDADLGAALATHWNFPESLAEAVASHPLNVDALPDPRSLAAQVIRARIFARCSAIPDGLEHPQRSQPPDEWRVPPVGPLMKRGGGLSAVLERVDSFLDTALGR